ncbi:MAG TPA: site-specific integrase [Pyrinomonadaceae bacterium]
MKINIKKPGEKGNPSKRCYYYEFALRGERYRGIIKDARNFAQAKQAAEAIWDDLFNKRFNPEPPAEAPPLLFSSFVRETYLPLQQTNKKRSYARDAQIAGVLCEFFKGRTLQEIKKSDVEEFKRKQSETKTKYERKRSPATVNRELAVLSAILTLAVDDELIPGNPCRRVKPMRADNERSRYLSKDEEKRLFAALDGEPLLQDIVTMAIHTGMRRGEIFNLRWFDVDFSRGVIHVRNTKTSKDRVVPMNAAAREMLERQPKTSGYVFPSPKTGGRLVDIKKKFNEACATAEIDDFRFHDLRHTAATRLADAGVNVIVIAEILGHGDIRTTKRYSHAMEEAKREAVEKLAKPGAVRQKSAKSRGKGKRQAGGPAVSN